MNVGDLVRITASEMRTPVGSIALIERVEDREDSRGVVRQYWARMMKSGDVYWFRREWIEVINASR
jgi:hypothetical protein